MQSMKKVDVGVQTDNLVIKSLERDNLELPAWIKNLQLNFLWSLSDLWEHGIVPLTQVL